MRWRCKSHWRAELCRWQKRVGEGLAAIRLDQRFSISSAYVFRTLRGHGRTDTPVIDAFKLTDLSNICQSPWQSEPDEQCPALPSKKVTAHAAFVCQAVARASARMKVRGYAHSIGEGNACHRDDQGVVGQYSGHVLTAARSRAILNVDWGRDGLNAAG
jgi:hypothetical protein